METTTYYSANKAQVLQKAHEYLLCECGFKVKRGAMGSHTKHSPAHRVWEQTQRSLTLKH
jgi:hypothetical protein